MRAAGAPSPHALGRVSVVGTSDQGPDCAQGRWRRAWLPACCLARRGMRSVWGDPGLVLSLLCSIALQTSAQGPLWSGACRRREAGS